jgi:hypothetical protein
MTLNDSSATQGAHALGNCEGDTTNPVIMNDSEAKAKGLAPFDRASRHFADIVYRLLQGS